VTTLVAATSPNIHATATSACHLQNAVAAMRAVNKRTAPSTPIHALDRPGDVHDAFAPTLRELRLGEHHLREIHRRAKLGDAVAQRELALAYCRGSGVRRDGPYAVKWMILAADSGDSEACRHLNYFVKGFPVDEIVEGRRLVARHRGQPVPSFGLCEGDTLHIEHEEAENEGLQESETTLMARDLEGVLENSSAMALTVQSPGTARADARDAQSRGWSNPLGALGGEINASKESPTAQASAVVEPPNWVPWVVAFSCAAVVVIVGGLAWMNFHSASMASASKALPFSPEDILHGAPAEDSVANPAETLAATARPVTPVTELSPLSQQLPASLRQISPALMARWEDLDGLRAKAGSADHEAEFDLAQWHLLKAQSPEDFAESVRLLRRAAEGGVVQAQNNLGFCLVTGTGAALDMAEGYKWFAIATARGLRGAQANRDRAAQMLSQDKRVEVSRQVDAYLARENIRPSSAQHQQPASDIKVSSLSLGALN